MLAKASSKFLLACKDLRKTTISGALTKARTIIKFKIFTAVMHCSLPQTLLNGEA
jgi:hypothetical protein